MLGMMAAQARDEDSYVHSRTSGRDARVRGRVGAWGLGASLFVAWLRTHQHAPPRRVRKHPKQSCGSAAWAEQQPCTSTRHGNKRRFDDCDCDYDCTPGRVPLCRSAPFSRVSPGLDNTGRHPPSSYSCFSSSQNVPTSRTIRPSPHLCQVKKTTGRLALSKTCCSPWDGLLYPTARSAWKVMMRLCFTARPASKMVSVPQYAIRNTEPCDVCLVRCGCLVIHGFTTPTPPTPQANTFETS